MKPLVWLGPSRTDVREFPVEARSEVGYQLYKVQAGLEPTDWKPMSSVGAGVREIRIHVGNEYRVLYLASRRTAGTDIQLARKRLASIRSERNVT